MVQYEEQAVLVSIQGVNFDELFPLEDLLAKSLENTGLGEFDGNEVGQGETTLFLYGPDAEKLFEHIRPILMETPVCKHGKAIIRYGKPGASSRSVSLN